MDPATISVTAAAALTALQPYIPVIVTKAAEKVGEGLPETIGRLWTALRKRIDVKEAAKEALNDLLAHPENEAFQTVFKVQLEKILVADPDFAKQLRELLSEVCAEPGTTYQAQVKGGGSIAQGTGARSVGAGGVMIEGGVQGNFSTDSK